jgi:hypothetical protein
VSSGLAQRPVVDPGFVARERRASRVRRSLAAVLALVVVAAGLVVVRHVIAAETFTWGPSVGSGTCPSVAPRDTVFAGSTHGAAAPRHASAVVLCGYLPVLDKDGAPVGSDTPLFSHVRAAPELGVRVLAGLRRARPAYGNSSCPRDDGSEIAVLIRRPGTTLWNQIVVGPTGCPAVSHNGSVWSVSVAGNPLDLLLRTLGMPAFD